jgi:2-polyprenyl-6-methoxyphenol hydroxylase-like FAD-dependent oxidoreductase
VGRTVDPFLAFAAKSMPGGTLDGARKAGPLGFLPNSCTWSSRIALGHVVLGDAAGALDPTQGLGTSLLFRDVRALSDLLTADRDRERATSEFARQRQAYYEVLRAYDRWCALLDSEEGPEADRRRELNASARERDPALGGFAASKPAARTGWYRMKRRVGPTSASRASMRVDECPIGAP